MLPHPAKTSTHTYRRDTACYKDPKARHGPYVYWTSKSKGKTVSRMLDPDEAKLLEEWIENRRKLDTTIRQMKAISHKAVKVALRLQKPS